MKGMDPFAHIMCGKKNNIYILCPNSEIFQINLKYLRFI